MKLSAAPGSRGVSALKQHARRSQRLLFALWNHVSTERTESKPRDITHLSG